MAGPIDKCGNVHAADGRFVSLRDYLEAVMGERDRAHKAEHVLIDTARNKAQELREEAIRQAREVLDQRLEKLNELRSAVEKDRGLLLTRDKYETEHAVLESRVGALENFRGKALGFGVLVALVSGVIGAIIQKAVGG